MSRRRSPRPFLKWPGGKGQILQRVISALDRVAADNTRTARNVLGRYVEPFLGGGAVFFEMHRTRRLALADTIELSDINQELITTYQAVQADVEGVILAIETFESAYEVSPGGLLDAADKTDEERLKAKLAFYNSVRALSPESPVAVAARMIWLNRHCFNGLYRQNKAGRMNSPWNGGAPVKFDMENLRACAKALAGVTIVCRSYTEALADLQPGDVAYLDPPYWPLKAGSFTTYAAGGFSATDHRRLATLYISAIHKGAHVVVSNSATPATRDLNRSQVATPLRTSRAINRNGRGRARAALELLIRPREAQRRCKHCRGWARDHFDKDCQFTPADDGRTLEQLSQVAEAL